MSNFDLVGISLDRDELEPSAIIKPKIKSVKIKIPFLSDNHQETTTKYEEIHKNSLIFDVEKQRNQQYSKYKISREKDDPFYYNTDSIKNKTELKGIEEAMDRNFVDLFKQYLVNAEYDKALYLTIQMKSIKSILVCKKLAERMNNDEFSGHLARLYEERKKINEIQEAIESNTGLKSKTDMPIIIMKQTESNPFLEKKDKLKKGLSSYAVQLVISHI